MFSRASTKRVPEPPPPPPKKRRKKRTPAKPPEYKWMINPEKESDAAKADRIAAELASKKAAAEHTWPDPTSAPLSPEQLAAYEEAGVTWLGEPKAAPPTSSADKVNLNLDKMGDDFRDISTQVEELKAKGTARLHGEGQEAKGGGKRRKKSKRKSKKRRSSKRRRKQRRQRRR